jgi:signal peptidase I
MKSVSRTKAFEIAISIKDLFPLFSPEGEKYWVPGWDYENVMGTTELSEDYVFLTKAHDHRTKDAIWIVKKYDPKSHFVQFYKIEPGDKIGVVTVKCSEQEAERTSVEVTYKYIALSATGEGFVSEFSESIYEKFIGEWQTLLSNYFRSKG